MDQAHKVSSTTSVTVLRNNIETRINISNNPYCANKLLFLKVLYMIRKKIKQAEKHYVELEKQAIFHFCDE